MPGPQLRKRREAIAKVGVGVSARAQTIFDAIDATLACRWDGSTIVVLDEVHIAEPYGPEQCTSSGKPQMLARVKMVLQHQLDRMAA